MVKLDIRNVTKLFGAQESAGLALARNGVSKSEILARTGCSLGLKDINLEIAAGEITVLMGLSGSGKSTLVRHLNRLIEPSSGTILYNGENILEFSAAELRNFRRHSVSMVFQGFGLLPHRTVLQNIAFGLAIRGETKSNAEKTAQQWIETVGLQGYADKFPHQLSGGMRQRVGLARALAVQTEIVLMDEAFSALDPLIRWEMQELLLGLQQELHRTIVFVTHDLNEAVRLGAEIAMMHDGELVQIAPPAEILANPAN